MNLNQRIDAFVKLGEFLRNFIDGNLDSDESIKLNDLITTEHIFNPWFTENNIRHSLKAIGESLDKSKINLWLNRYQLLGSNKQSKRIGVVMAGNLPLVGFHDFISVLISGNAFIGKLSSKDNKLLKFIADYLIDTNYEFKKLIYFTQEKLENFDAVIATGNNNTSRYFEYYFGKYPHIIRKNRSSFGILTGKESDEEIKKLGTDIFSYFGLGCRNVSKLFIPEDFSFNQFFENIQNFEYVYRHNKYANNYDYNKSIYLMNQIQQYDNGFLILKEDENLSSPIGVLYYQHYNNLSDVRDYIDQKKDEIQCIVSTGIIGESVPFGKAQQPELWDYADNIDTMQFLQNL